MLFRAPQHPGGEALPGSGGNGRSLGPDVRRRPEVRELPQLYRERVFLKGDKVGRLTTVAINIERGLKLATKGETRPPNSAKSSVAIKSFNANALGRNSLNWLTYPTYAPSGPHRKPRPCGWHLEGRFLLPQGAERTGNNWSTLHQGGHIPSGQD